MKIILLLITMVLSLGNSFAQELDYPELNVTPKSTKRVQLEIKEEAGHAWSSNFAVQASALMTLMAGAMSSSSLKDDGEKRDMAPVVGFGVGAAWLGLTSWMAMSYRPYKDTLKKLKKLPYKTKRQKVIAERMAEEQINSLRKLGRKLRWFSVGTNLIASAYLLENVEEKSDAQVMAGLSAAASFLPLFFSYHWEDVADEQEKYKKKIFGPLTMSPILLDPINRKKATGMNFTLLF